MRYFKEHEFDSPDLMGSGRHMKPFFLDMLEMARGAAGTPFKINSGYRTKEHNKKVGGSETSSHLIGFAADIHCTSSVVRERIIYGLVKAGFQRIGIADTFIHCDVDPMKSPAIWLY